MRFEKIWVVDFKQVRVSKSSRFCATMLTKFEEWTKFPYEIREFTKLRYNFSMKFKKGRKAFVYKPPNERTILTFSYKDNK